MCGLSLAWVTTENSTTLLESDSSWLTLAGPYHMLPRLSAPVSGVDRPCPWIHANLSAVRLSAVQPPTALSALQPPTASAGSRRQLPSSGSPVNCLSRVPFPLPDTARFHVQESFVWFRAKTDSSALAAYPHSATYHHHHHIVLAARISLTLSRHSSLSFIALGRSSGQQPVSSHSCWMYVRAGRPAFARPCVGINKSTSLMSSSLLLQQCPACLVRLTWIVFVIGGRWPYSWCLVGCCCQDLFRIARSILV